MDDTSLVALVVDDEPDARELLKELLYRSPYIGEVYCSDSVDNGIKEIITRQPDILFLDVEMPHRNGFDLVDELKNLGIRIHVVFTTGFEKYAIRAIRASAADYLLKPIDPEELESAIKRVMTHKFHHPSAKNHPSSVVGTYNKPPIRINTRNGFALLSEEEIFYVIADWNYCDIYLTSTEKITASMNIGTIETILPAEQFYRINRSTIVNLRYLKMVDRKMNQCRIVYSLIEETFNIPRYRIRDLESRLNG